MKACNQCGKCCLRYSDGGLSATADEIAWWEIFRPQIARYVHDGAIWAEPGTGAALAVCPWLEQVPAAAPGSQPRYQCQIYHDRPQDCRDYPVDLNQMVSDDCEMIELRDLDNPAQAERARMRLLS
ncbi:MAG: YkgJ family cysteine cluster protein [Pseudomonadales bacterium]